MKQHTMIYVDLGYVKDPTQIVVIKNDAIYEIATLAKRTDINEVVDYVIDLVTKYGLRSDQVRAYAHPALEHAVRERMGKRGVV